MEGPGLHKPLSAGGVFRWTRGEGAWSAVENTLTSGAGGGRRAQRHMFLKRDVWAIVEFRIRGYRCLEDFVVDVEDLLVILGPNGAGKSSLLEALYLAASGGGATPPGPQTPLKIVLMARGEPFSPDFGRDRAQLNETVLSRVECAPGGDAELNKLLQGISVQLFFGWLAKLSGLPVSEFAYRELGRLYLCGPGGASAAAVFANFVVDWRTGGVGEALLVTPRLAAEMDYVAPLVDTIAVGNPGWFSEVMRLFEKYGVRDVRNINGIPHVVGRSILPMSAAPAGLAYALVASLALGGGRFIFVDEPEAHMHPTLINTVRDAVESALDAGRRVVVATQSIEVVDKLASIGRGRVLRMRDCKKYDEIEMPEARRRLDEFYEDLRYY